jgi:hypothetical protein
VVDSGEEGGGGGWRWGGGGGSDGSSKCLCVSSRTPGIANALNPNLWLDVVGDAWVRVDLSIEVSRARRGRAGIPLESNFEKKQSKMSIFGNSGRIHKSNLNFEFQNPINRSWRTVIFTSENLIQKWEFLRDFSEFGRIWLRKQRI